MSRIEPRFDLRRWDGGSNVICHVGTTYPCIHLIPNHSLSPFLVLSSALPCRFLSPALFLASFRLLCPVASFLLLFESMLSVQDHHILSHIWYQHFSLRSYKLTCSRKQIRKNVNTLEAALNIMIKSRYKTWLYLWGCQGMCSAIIKVLCTTGKWSQDERWQFGGIEDKQLFVSHLKVRQSSLAKLLDTAFITFSFWEPSLLIKWAGHASSGCTH